MIKDILISDPVVPIGEQIHINVIHIHVDGETAENGNVDAFTVRNDIFHKRLQFTISIFFSNKCP